MPTWRTWAGHFASALPFTKYYSSSSSFSFRTFWRGDPNRRSIISFLDRPPAGGRPGDKPVGINSGRATATGIYAAAVPRRTVLSSYPPETDVADQHSGPSLRLIIMLHAMFPPPSGKRERPSWALGPQARRRGGARPRPRPQCDDNTPRNHSHAPRNSIRLC